jgi:hemolysin III
MTSPLAKRYSVAEEIAHSVTHGLGLLLAIAGLAVLVGFATVRGDASHVTAVSIYGATLVLLYAASTLYHSIPIPRAKRVLRLIDHAAIYLLIAGTYTPFMLVTLRGGWGWPVFWVVWGIAVVGIVVELATGGNAKKLSLSMYLGMGWMAILLAKPMLDSLPTGGLVLLGLGGLSYTAGVGFYVSRRLRFHHAIWHLFVLAGSALHYFAVLLYVIPPTP